ncbi:unnamed protein product [Danaus chrysippus]|uniref:(African queen) hypothetical protein n=1 Tax=Danaus chrysippus TaxID=151541 RepID=A0A8J2R570_9NEOP|nr:unnamed protein product [Danaus chrysippus]
MFSPRFLMLCTLVAATAAFPANNNPIIPKPITTITETDFDEPSPWFRFPVFGNIFAPLTKLFSTFADVGPRIEVDDDSFRVVVNVKDYKKEDLKVKVKGGFIFIEGSHEAKHDDHDLFASQFFHTYTLPYNASAEEVKAVLTSDQFLEVSVPLNGGAGKDDKEVDRVVPIVESGEPLEKVDKPQNDDVELVSKAGEEPKSTTEVATTLAEVEDERKEPTTPAEVEATTTEDNKIPSDELNEVSDANEIKP